MPCGMAAVVLWAIMAAALAPASHAGGAARSLAQAGPSWQLLWGDEFNGPELQPDNWEPSIGNGCQYGIAGWGNSERQWYTDLPQNLRVDNGNLVMSALWDPSAAAIRDQPLTSARIRTFGKHSFGPSPAHPVVRVEARIKLPSGLGLWPAFWMLPTDDATASCSGCGRHGVWAASGEIDIMEVANDARQLLGTLHYGGPWPYNSYSSSNLTLPGGASFAEDFHTFGIEWSANEMRWYLDGQLYGTQNSAKGDGSKNGWFSLGRDAGSIDAPALPGNAPFGTQQFYLIFNLAMGSEGTPFTTKMNNGAPVMPEQLINTLAAGPKTMLVDWVRVWGSSPS